MPHPILVVDDASFRYGQRQVLDQVALSVDLGEIFVLLGPNGSGKSTLVKAITGQIQLDRGEVRVAGSPPASAACARRNIGVVPQNIALYEKLNGSENLNVIGRLMGVASTGLSQRIHETLDRVNLGDRAKDRAEILSGGMRRRLNIAAALMHNPKLLILDEPTAGVDQAGKQAVRDLLISLRDSGLAVLLTTHEMDEAQALADRVGIIVDGQVKAAGSPSELVRAQFGNAIELTVQLDDAETSSPEIKDTFSELGMHYDTSTGQWRGLVEEDEASMQPLVQKIVHTGQGVKDVRIRRPGLDTLLARLTEQDQQQ